ncbi:MAG TPA: ornithine cyclodeaminase family protein [Caulobacteraceae bacterium]|jgi:ornithine cyclodeaminase
MRFIDAKEVRQRLTYAACIPLMREAMMAFSAGRTRQLLRSIIPLADGALFGVMPGALGVDAPFGAKLISVFPDNFGKGGPSHQGLIVLFEPASGAPVCVVDAGEVTAIRTAAASAMATDALARPGPAGLALLGYGEQARQHLRAIAQVRKLASAVVWGRHPEHAQAFAAHMRNELAMPIAVAASAQAAVAEADIVCTLTPATEPILEGTWIAPGAHVNLVGAGHAGQAEADGDLVARSRFFVDSREGVLAQGGEFLRARAAGLVDDSHIRGEIGEVLAGSVPGRRSGDEITAYKSLGHVAQDLASAWALYTGEGL